MHNRSKFKSLLIGNARPSVGFWFFQYAFLLFAFAGPVCSILALSKISDPTSNWLFYVFVAAIYLFPAGGWILHIVAVFRSAKWTRSKVGATLCRLYPVGFSLALIGALAFIASASISRFDGKARQSEPKILLRQILDGERFSLKNSGSYSDIKNIIGLYSHDQLGYYRYAIVVCENFVKKAPILIERKGKNSEDSIQPTLLASLKQWAAEEDCSRRKNGFAAFAAGKISKKSDVIDLWRIDESGELRNIQSGL